MQSLEQFFEQNDKIKWMSQQTVCQKIKSQKLIYEGQLIYHDFNKTYYNYFKLYQDHLIKFETIDEKKQTYNLDIQKSQVLFLNLISVDVFEFENQSCLNLKYGIHFTNNYFFILCADNQESMLIWFEKFKQVCILHYFENYYQLQEQLGSGGFSKVVKAFRIADQKKFAVKIFNKSTIKLNKKASILKKSILQEIEIQRLLLKESFCQLYEVYESQNYVYLVLEHLKGGELFDRIIQKGNYTEKDANNLFQQLLKGLDQMHKLGIIHRDIKPENLVFKELDSYSLAIIDFGISEFIDNQSMYNRAGTPGYVAPEILRDEKYDQRSDIFSAGCILYVLLTGCSPFNSKNTEELIEKNLKVDVFYDFKKIGIEISQLAIDLLKKMLVSNPFERITIQNALQHDWIKQFQKLEIIESPLKKNKNLVQKNLEKLKNQNKNKVIPKEQSSPLSRKSFQILQQSPNYINEKKQIYDSLKQSFIQSKETEAGSPIKQKKPIIQIFQC